MVAVLVSTKTTQQRRALMPIIAKAGTDFIPAPEGSHPAVCVDVVDLGILELTFNGRTEKKHMIRLVWQINESAPNGKPFTVSRRFTLSLHKKAALRAVLESWRGRAFTDTELRGFDIETQIGMPCLLNVVHNSHDGSTFANVAGVMRLPKGLEAPKPSDYVRVKDRQNSQDGQDRADLPDSASDLVSDDDVPF